MISQIRYNLNGVFIAYNVSKMKNENLVRIQEKSMHTLVAVKRFTSKFVVEQIKTLGVDESTALLYVALFTGTIFAIPALIRNTLHRKKTKTEK